MPNEPKFKVGDNVRFVTPDTYKILEAKVINNKAVGIYPFDISI